MPRGKRAQKSRFAARIAASACVYGSTISNARVFAPSRAFRRDKSRFRIFMLPRVNVATQQTFSCLLLSHFLVKVFSRSRSKTWPIVCSRGDDLRGTEAEPGSRLFSEWQLQRGIAPCDSLPEVATPSVVADKDVPSCRVPVDATHLSSLLQLVCWHFDQPGVFTCVFSPAKPKC